MDPGSIKLWLRRKTFVEACWNIPLAFGSLLLSLPLIAALLGVGYLVFFFLQIAAIALAENFLHKRWAFSHPANLGCASIVVVLIFLGCLRAQREMSRFSRSRPFPFLSGMPRDLSALAAEHLLGSKVIVDLLYSGPRCFIFAFSSVAKSIRLFNFDTETCSKFLAVLLQRGKRISFTELERIVAIPFSRRLLIQLNDIQGVVFFLREPPGLSLTEDLRTELRKAIAKLQGKAPPTAHVPPEEPTVIVEPPDELAEAYRMLGVTRDASLAEIKTAYRKCMKNCHPDYFQDFGEDWKQLAQEKTRRLIDAYEKIIISRA